MPRLPLIAVQACWTLHSQAGKPSGMAGQSSSKGAASKAKETREERLKKALKANMARRKAQARARAENETTQTSGKEDE